MSSENKVQPLRDYILLAKEEQEEKVAGGLLYKPQTVENNILTLRVLAVGPGYVTTEGATIAPDVKVGDMVMLYKNNAVPVTVDGVSYYLAREDSFFCKVS